MVVRGAVQGVGFRPFVYRLASELDLAGWVRNSALGVVIEIEGPSGSLEAFRRRLEREKPPRAFIQSVEASVLDPVGHIEFKIAASDAAGATEALVLPDIAMCSDCGREIRDPANRRYRYPFTNCTNCGPRFTIITAMPYDRPNTTMRGFEMCPACRAEHENPADRRFHAQPNACPDCGPQLALWDHEGHVLAARDDALRAAVEAIRGGAIVAVKGLGGFHLLADARNDTAVRELRRRKSREEKPLACMFPSLESARESCAISASEERLLTSPESPIVLVRIRSPKQAAVSMAPPATPSVAPPVTRPGAGSSAPSAAASVAPPVAPSAAPSAAQSVSQSVAPGNPYLGVMLPYTPLHALLLDELGFPVVATSGNLSEEPICVDEHDALERLGAIADCFLVHDRPIVRHVDDSIVRICAGREMLLRRARGYAPLPIPLHAPVAPLLAVGAHLKNSVALASGTSAFVAQHIGDLETKRAQEAFTRVIDDLGRLLDLAPQKVACDLHPDYTATRFARASRLPVVGVQHHVAHARACIGENEVALPALAVTWDGTGYGADGSIWGGEFLRMTGDGYDRAAHFRTFRLPGGEAAVREPRRSAFGLLYEILGEGVLEDSSEASKTFTSAERHVLYAMLSQGLHSPITSSAGRLFDAVASLAGLRQTMRFEGQAAMELEFAAERAVTEEAYPFSIVPTPESSPPAGLAAGGASVALVVDWQELVRAILFDRSRGVEVAPIARKFHNALAEIIVALAQRCELQRVVLTGGCFQNALLSERAIDRLRQEGFKPYWHQRVPPNDGGIALGQVLEVLARKE